MIPSIEFGKRCWKSTIICIQQNCMVSRLKYLIESEEVGWVGAMGFSSASWRIKPRDERIGWDEEARRRDLKRVVCNSRFLIVPWLRERV